MDFFSLLKNSDFESKAVSAQFGKTVLQGRKLCIDLLQQINEIKGSISESELYWKTFSAESERESFFSDAEQFSFLEDNINNQIKKFDAIIAKYAGASISEEISDLPQDVLF